VTEPDRFPSPPESGLSALVFNYNGGERILNTLAALEKQRSAFDSIVVVDNGSDDGSLESIVSGFGGVEVVELGENLGLPAARNAGLRRVESELVLMVDGDVYLEEGCVERLVCALRSHDAAVVCPRIRLLPESEVVQADGAAPHFIGTLRLRHAYQPLAALSDTVADVGGCMGACMLLDRRKVIQAGGFDELFFFYLEDLDFTLRMRIRGFRFVCDPGAVVYHDRGEGTPGLGYRGGSAYPARRAYLTIRNRLLAILIAFRLRTIVVLAPALVAYELASLALCIRRGWVGEWLQAWTWLIRNRGVIRERRKRVQASRVLPDREIFVGGALPLAHGVIRSRAAGVATAALSSLLDGYWKLARPWVG
jgi:hypothetical protein